MTSVYLQNISKRFGEFEALKDIDFSVDSGEFVVLVGPSGCGKTTLLRIIAGLEDASDGSISFDERVVDDVPPSKRGAAMVFQSYALYPHKTVAENMGFALKMSRMPKDEITKQVQEAAATLQLEKLLDRKPRELSGGQRQRVAIGRAIVRHPGVFLFDEPLSNLDAALRVDMRLELARLHCSLGTTMIYVTHDQIEAMTLATKIVVMRDGRVEQIGTPRELYERPANKFVAGFLGMPQMNFVGTRFAAGPRPDGVPDAAVEIGVRPEHVNLESGPADAFKMNATVSHAEYLGAVQTIYLDIEHNAERQRIVATTNPARSFEIGSSQQICFAADHCHFFDRSGQSMARA